MISAASALTALYGASGLAACAFYVPQLRKLMTSGEARRAMSLASWGAWSALGGVALAYALVVVGDPTLTMVNAANLTCQLAVFGLAAAQSLADRRAAGDKKSPPAWEGAGGKGGRRSKK